MQAVSLPDDAGEGGRPATLRRLAGRSGRPVARRGFLRRHACTAAPPSSV